MQKTKKQWLVQKHALRYFIEGEDKKPKSRKHAYKILREETGLPKFMLKKAIQSAYSALF